MSTGYLYATGSCWACGSMFTFDPELVPAVTVDPETRTPPDLLNREQFDEALARSRREPLCEDCVELANRERQRLGHSPIVVPRGAYPFRGG